VTGSVGESASFRRRRILSTSFNDPFPDPVVSLHRHPHPQRSNPT